VNALEIIHLRMASASAETLADVIRNSVVSEPTLLGVHIYRHAKLETDLMVHLHRSFARAEDGECECGERLASLLRAYGMVEHSVWVEEASEPSG
jgi:hypothetical protein